MKSFKNMSEEEFTIERKKAINRKLSPKAKFMVDSQGYAFRLGSYKVDKWEVLADEHFYFDDILDGNTKYTAYGTLE